MCQPWPRIKWRVRASDSGERPVKLNLFNKMKYFWTSSKLFFLSRDFVCIWVSGRRLKAFDPSHITIRMKWHFPHDLLRSRFKLTLNSCLVSFQIYTEWANYYLERHNSKRKVVDLSVDVRDGLLLAEIIEAVTSFKVPDLIKKPKSQQQMVSRVVSINQRRFSRLSNERQLAVPKWQLRRIWKINKRNETSKERRKLAKCLELNRFFWDLESFLTNFVVCLRVWQISESSISCECF